MINKNEMDKRNLSQVQHEIFPIHEKAQKSQGQGLVNKVFFSEQVCLQFDLSVSIKISRGAPFLEHGP